MEFAITYYSDPKGAEPVREFLTQLEKVNSLLWKATLAAIQKIKQQSNQRMPLSKPLGNGLFEIRVRANMVISRVLYCFRPGREIILLHGFIKKTEKTPPEDIKIAMARLEDLNRRIKNEKR